MAEKNNNQEHSEELFFMEHAPPRDNKLRSRHEVEWVEETYVGGGSNGNRMFDHYMGLTLSARKINVLIFLIFLSLFMLFTRSVYLQIIKGDEYYDLAENNRIRIHHVHSPRGIIYDRNNVALVNNIPSFSLFITPVDFPSEGLEKEEAVQLINEYLEFDEESRQELDKILSITSLRKEYFQEHVLSDNIEYEKAIQLQLAASDISGMSIGSTNKRKYVLNKSMPAEYMGNSLSHILGYVGKINSDEYSEKSESGYLFNDVIGKSGIEKNYETLLRGKYGKKQIEVDSMGQEKKIIAQIELQRGDNLILTLDSEMQLKLEQIIRNKLLEMNLTKAIGIIQNPNNGEVLAMVSLPSFDNNDFSQGISQEKYLELLNNEDNPLFNRAVSGEYPSGSTIKPVIAAAALEEGLINASKSFLSVGGIRISQWFFPDWKAGGHGITDVRKALADSVNTFFYIIGGGYGDIEGLGVLRIKEYCERFGMSFKTGIDLPSESPGFIPDPDWKKEAKNERWYIGDTYHMAIGQGDLLVTPLQVNNFTAYFANGGTLYKPRLVKSIIDPETGQETQMLPEAISTHAVSNENNNIVRQGMRQAITSGSGKYLNSLPVTSAGKTGTAQWGFEKKPHAWFTSFAPYENPELVVTILIEEGEEGSKAPVRVTYDFYRWYFSTYKNSQAYLNGIQAQ